MRRIRYVRFFLGMELEMDGYICVCIGDAAGGLGGVEVSKRVWFPYWEIGRCNGVNYRKSFMYWTEMKSHSFVQTF